MNLRYANISRLCAIAGFTLFCISVLFGDLLDVTLHNNVRYLFWIVSVCFMIIGCSSNGQLIIRKKLLYYSASWILFTLIYVVGYNQSIYKSSYYTTFRWLYYFLFMYLIAIIKTEFYSIYLRILKFVAGFYVSGVYFFLLFPQAYKIMFTIWGYWPTGTNNGLVGFRAGIANHYSENAMYIVTTLIIVITQYWGNQTNRKKWKQILQIVMVILALIATTKRAHVMFGVLALVCAYYIFKPEERMNRTFKIIVGFMTGFILLYISSFFVPFIGVIFERFSNIGVDEESNTRFLMWALALKNFKENVIIGIGWNGYKYQFNRYLYNPIVRAERFAYLNAHNVYFQLLCETGIFGFLLYISGSIKMISKTLYLLRKNMDNNELWVVLFSLTMQIFFLLYSLTGNCLYDTMFAFYIVAVGCLLGYITQKYQSDIEEKCDE